MRVLHAALLPTAALGIQQQMVWEQAAARAEGLDWSVRMFTPFPIEEAGETAVYAAATRQDRGCASKAGLADWVKYRRSFHDWLLEEARGYDLVLLRHSPFDPFRAGLIDDLPARVASVHHTMEVPQLELVGGLAGRWRSIAEARFGRRSLKRVDAVVGVTPEICRYEAGRINTDVLTLVYPNGVWMPPEGGSAIDERGDTPELVFVASRFMPWHGLDRLLHALEKSSADVVLHLAGEVPTDMLALLRQDGRVRHHGVLRPGELSNLLRRAWVGLSSFALDRNRMSQACTLKVREYLQAGVVVYSGYEDVFPSGSGFYRHGATDIVSILAFAKSRRSWTRERVIMEARPFIDKRILVHRCHAELARLFAGSLY